MRIGCLQFAPRVGDINNNLNRADSVLAKANPDDLDTLDVLVLPELAFTGYNFKSLQHISPYLEPSGSGISSLWARTTALKYNTNVVVGYPERADVSTIWPTGPEYYNSAIVVNGDGETVANYRKSFLYSVDESWALEGQDGFFEGHVRGLGQTALGICMDLNPYRFEAPWTDFEFGFHILEVRAHLVIVTMAWLTREDKRHFSRMPAEPDMETLTYWIQRLEPVIRAEDEEEVIVVFCNRTGSEDDAVYAGTSAVVGIKDGEVHVYGLLGRGSKEVLVVDTDDIPFAKLVHRPEGETPGIISQFDEDRSQAAAKTKGTGPKEAEPAPRISQPLAQRSSPKVMSRKERPTPKLEIPEQPRGRTRSTSHTTPIAESPMIPTPTAPSPTPLSARPKIGIPGTRPSGEQLDISFSRGDELTVKGRVVSNSISISSGTPMSGTPVSASNDSEHPTKYFWPSSDISREAKLEAPLRSPTRGVFIPAFPAPPESPTVPSSLVRCSECDHRSRADAPKSKLSSAPDLEGIPSPGRSRKSEDSEKVMPARPATSNDYTPARPASPKSRNASRSGRHEQYGPEAEEPDITAMTARLEALRRRTQSAIVQPQDRSETPTDGRPKSTKSRNASRSGRPSDMDFSFMERDLYRSRGSICIGANESVLGSDIVRPRSDILARDQSFAIGNPAHSGLDTCHHSMSDLDRAASRVEDHLKPIQKPSANAEPAESRTMLWSEISKIVGEHMGRPESQEDIRGRQRSTSAAPVQTSQGSRDVLTNVRAASTQARPESGGAFRSVKEPSMGTPANPDDEIVAEIIFRRPGLPNHTSRSNSRGAGTPDRPAGSRTSRRDSSRHGPDDNKPFVGKVLSPLGKAGEKPVASKATQVEHKSASVSPPLAPRIARDDPIEASLPGLSGSSIHTLNSDKTSPSTPSPRYFEPSTPKAMVLPPEYGSLLSRASDPLSDVKFNALLGDQTMAQFERPRSSVW